MKYYIACFVALVGGVLLVIPADSLTPGPTYTDSLSVAYKADRESKVSILRQLAAMTGTSTEERSRAWSKMDMEGFSKSFDKVGDDVSQAIADGKELELSNAWDKK